MATKLTTEQINRLYSFTREHFVYHYDIQSELVDHLANDIENQWIENGTLDFETALDNAFKKFGIFGFGDVVEEKTSSLTKRYHKIIWQHFVQYLYGSKILVTLSVFLTVFLSLYLIKENGYVVLAFAAGVLIYIFYGMISNLRKNKKKIKKEGKKYLFDEIMTSYMSGGSMSFLPLQIYFQSTILGFDKPFSIYFILVFALMITIVFVFYRIVNIEIPSKRIALLKEVYPERFVVSD